MSKIKEAQQILKALGLPAAQQNEMSALTLLALGGLGPRDPWAKAERRSATVTKDIMAFVAKAYRRKYAPNTRETFRRHVLHQFVQARMADYNPDNPGLPTNSPRAHYALTEEALAAIRAYGTSAWSAARRRFLSRQGSLREVYRSRREARLIPVRLSDGTEVELSPGEHNQVQAAVVKEFAGRFAPGSELLYLGDTAKKVLVADSGGLAKVGIHITEHEKLPDVVLYDRRRDRLFMIEVVASHGPMSPKRVVELRVMLSSCKAATIFVTAFPDFATFRKFSHDIAWETEVWIVEIPDHLIHYNGDKFLGPHS